MRLLEYQAKALFGEAGIAVPRGGVAARPDDVPRLVEAFGPRVMVKAQARVGGRGKAGGIVAADGPAEARAAAERLIGGQLAGEPVESVLVEERLTVAAELFAAILIDREAGRPLVLLGAAGGVDVESAAESQPSSIARILVDPAFGLAEFQVRYLLGRAGLAAAARAAAADVLRRLEALSRQYDALLAEINPLAILADGRLVALDGRAEIDDNALFRQPRIAALRQLSATEARVEAAGFHYVPMAGQVGIISTGSGACMALMDLLTRRGLRPANFMELGQSMGTGGSQVAAEVLLERDDIDAILVAGYSGGPLERLAGGVLEVLAKRPDRALPVVVSLQGRNDAEAMQLAAESADPRVHAAPGYRAAIDRLAELVGGRGSGVGGRSVDQGLRPPTADPRPPDPA
jgi:succinyl-CoA synthetase beta subunit